MGLVCSVETFKGCTIKIVKRTSGFNGLSTYQNDSIRKIELKTMQRSDYWIAINGFTAIDKLFFDKDYWLYFALVPENIIVMTKALPFIEEQLNIAERSDYLEDLRNWIASTKGLSKKSGLKFIPRINIKFSLPIRSIVEKVKSKTLDEEWSESIIEIWENKKDWRRIFPNELNQNHKTES